MVLIKDALTWMRIVSGEMLATSPSPLRDGTNGPIGLDQMDSSGEFLDGPNEYSKNPLYNQLVSRF